MSANTSNYPPDFPQEYIDALEALYAKYGSNQTDGQKDHILASILGPCSFSGMGCSRWTPEEFLRLKVATVEMDYLESIGLYKPTLM